MAATVNAGAEVALIVKSLEATAPAPGLLQLDLKKELREALSDETEGKLDPDGSNAEAEAGSSQSSSNFKAHRHRAAPPLRRPDV